MGLVGYSGGKRRNAKGNREARVTVRFCLKERTKDGLLIKPYEREKY
jgi:hypothetical protein